MSARRLYATSAPGFAMGLRSVVATTPFDSRPVSSHSPVPTGREREWCTALAHPLPWMRATQRPTDVPAQRGRCCEDARLAQPSPAPEPALRSESGTAGKDLTVRDLAVRELDDIAVVSFLLESAQARPARSVVTMFVVDVWRQSSSKLLSRYVEQPAVAPARHARQHPPAGNEPLAVSSSVASDDLNRPGFPRAGDAARDRLARRGRLKDRLACHAGELRPHMADDLEVRGNVLELFRDVLTDQAKPAAASRATARLALRVVVVVAGLGSVDLRLTRQVCRQAAIDLGRVRRVGLRGLLGRRKFIQWCAFDQSGGALAGGLQAP